eukprot:2812932-Rhodomonas_salina.1
MPASGIASAKLQATLERQGPYKALFDLMPVDLPQVDTFKVEAGGWLVQNTAPPPPSAALFAENTQSRRMVEAERKSSAPPPHLVAEFEIKVLEKT